MTDSSKPGGKPVDGIERIREIVLGGEKVRLNSLERRITDLESRTNDVAEVLPSAMERLVDDPVSLPDIEKPVVKTIRSAIKRDTESFAEALFPVLGPAIRRAVADALKALVQHINVALENSFTIKGLKWRVEAARTGVPFAQVMLRHTMLYTVQEAFLIQRGSGLILAGAQRDAALALDEDAVAAMLTAIQAFIQDSLGMGSDEPLRSAELGDRTIWVVNGPNAVLACVISGTPPGSLRVELMELLESLHARFGIRLAEHPPVIAGDDGLRVLLDRALREEEDESASGARNGKFKALWIAVGLLLLCYLLFSTFNAWRDRQFTHQVKALFSLQSGYVITAAEMDHGILKINGLRDPVTPSPSSVLESQQIPVDRVITNFSPYQSLDPALVISRLERHLDFGPLTLLVLENDVLKVTGAVSSQQFITLKRLPEVHSLIRSVHLDGISLNPGEAAALAGTSLGAPKSVSITPVDNRLQLDGTAGAAWYKAAKKSQVDVPGWTLDFRPLEQNLSSRLDQHIEGLHGQVFQYTDGNQITPASFHKLDSVAAELVQAQALAGALGTGLEITLEGSSDGVGSPEKNTRVSMDRSRHLLAELAVGGVNRQGITQTVAAWKTGDIDLSQRIVTLNIKRGDHP